MSYKVAVVNGADPRQVHARNRAQAAADLYKSGRVSKVITTGKGEANELAQIVSMEGIPPGDIMKETRSETTYQSLKNVTKILDDLSQELGPLELAYLISQEWHRSRVLHIAARVLGVKYPYEFHAASDGRTKDYISRDAGLERVKMAFDNVTLSVPLLGELVNSLGYRFLRCFGKLTGK
jgi:uncharacterized SAM-binding protein YcdF (DUF218 family)